MKKILLVLVLTASMVLCLSFGAVAWGWGWGLPLKPGDHVIDYTRLKNSGEVTAEAINNALQTLQLYENKQTSLTPTQEQDKIVAALNACRNAIQQVTLTGPLKQSDAWNAFEAPKDENLSPAATADQNAAMRTVGDNANFDAAGLIRLQNNNARQIGTEINRLAATSEEGTLGQRQVGNLQRALLLQMTMDNLYTEAAADMAAVASSQREVAAEQIAIRQQQELRVKAYDPYNRTAQDDAYYPATAGRGYPKISR